MNDYIKGTPFAYKRIWNGSCFTLHNQRELYIKHSEALAFTLDGRECILGMYDVCWPKRVDKETFFAMQGHLVHHDNMMEEFSNRP